MDTYERKLHAALNELSQAGIDERGAMPPIFRMFRQMGIRPRPPHYTPPYRLAVMQGLWFCCAWGMMMWFFSWQGEKIPVIEAIVMAIAAGAVFGLGMTALSLRTRKKLKLSRWEDL